jgi:hypothetical protein
VLEAQLWEYYKAYMHRRPDLDAPAIFHCGPGTYMSDLYEHMVFDVGVAESKSLPELRYLLSLNVCVWWVSGSDACGMGQFCACVTGFSEKVVFVLGAVQRPFLSERRGGLSGSWLSGTHFPWWTVRVPGPMHNDPLDRCTLGDEMEEDEDAVSDRYDAAEAVMFNVSESRSSV